ncbi:MAG: GNAT family N-acetyltransferase [Candidatus Dormibacteria bacterium]
MTSTPVLDAATRALAAQPQHSARLLLRPLAAADRDQVARIYRDPEVMRYIDPGQDFTDDEVDRRMAAAQARWVEAGFDMWTMLERESGEFVGRGGLILSDELGEVEVGYMLARERWGMGFATELTEFALGFGFRTIGLDRVVAVVDGPHTASQHVLQKAGLTYQKETTYKGGPVRYFAIDRPAWEGLA